jgi:RNA polymerase sigma factor (sigma-70 family)
MDSATQDLVRGALAGDRTATRQLFAHVIVPVVERRLGYRLALAGADRSELHDHVQEVLVHLLERNGEVLRRWDAQRGTLEAYVGKVADNLLISRLRKRPPPTPTEDLDLEVGTAPPPSDGAAYTQLVVRLVREMSEADAALFRAVYLEERTPEEAALLLGIKRDAAYKRIQRLRDRLTELLSNVSREDT